MRIAVANALLPSEEQSGVPYQVHRLANTFVERDHDVTVFSLSERPQDAKYRLHKLRRMRVSRRLDRMNVSRHLDPFVFGYAISRVDFSSFDVLNIHGDSFLLWRCHPHVRTFHGSAADEARAATTFRRRGFFHVINLLERFSATFSDHNVGPSENTKRRFPNNTSVIQCGVDTASFYPGEKTRNPTVLFVGTTGGRKRGRWLAELFSRDVIPHVPNAELIMVCEKDVELPNVRFAGRVSDDELARLYRSSWVFCLPSTYEGFGVPYIESMASGTAVVASPNPGACEVLDDGRYGMIASDEALAGTLVDLLTSESRRMEIAALGLERSESYRWEAIAAKYESVFQRLLTR